MRTARIVAVKTEERNLKAGDLYSDKGPEYWNHAMRGAGIAPQVWVMPNRVEFDSNDPIYRLTIVVDDDKGTERDPHKMADGVDPATPPGVSAGEYRR